MKNICIILFLGLLLFSCNDPYENNLYKAYAELPVASYMESRPEVFSMWSGIIERAGLFNTLNLQTLQKNTYTCFVPDNNAVTEYLKSKGLSSVNDLSIEDAATLVKYHTMPAIAYTQSMFTSGVITYPTVTDDNLSLEFHEGGLNSIYLNGVARLVEIDDTVTNGVIHVIDHVLAPITETVADKLNSDRYSIFNQAVISTGYKDSLKQIKKDILDSYGNTTVKKFKYTVFAVSDSVFKSNKINSFEKLLDTLNVTGTDYSSASNPLNRYVAYHILDQTRSYSDLSAFPSGTSTMNVSCVSNDLINLRSVFGTLYLNYDSNDKTGVVFVNTDNNCKNGVIHEVSELMPVKTPPLVGVLWDLTDYSDLASVCKSYKSSSLSSAYLLEVTSGLVSCYKWKTIPETMTGSVYYRNSAKSGETVGFSLNNHDQLRLTLGISGWIEMKSPVLIQGKYKISITYDSPSSKTSKGIMLCSMDGVQLGNQVVVSNTGSEAVKTAVLSSSFEFTKTEQHVLRIISIDGNLLQLDCVTFEPENN